MNTYINNIIVGKLNIDHGGVMHVRNVTHGQVAKMKFKQPGMLQFRSGDLHVVSPLLPLSTAHSGYSTPLY